MKNAPVYFVLTQIRHNPVLNLPTYAAAIQDQMRKSNYPGFAKGINFSFAIPNSMDSMGTQESGQPTLDQFPRFTFSSADGTRVFIIDLNAITFYTTMYETFEGFTEEFIKGVQIIDEVVKLELNERLGLRYLDAVEPPSGEEGLREYLSAGVLGINSSLPKDTNVARSFSETIFETPKCMVTSRTVIQNAPLGFPPDLLQIEVKLSEKFKNINGVHAIIDTDAWIEGRREFNIDSIKSELKILQEASRLAFDLTVTPAALEAWKG